MSYEQNFENPRQFFELKRKKSPLLLHIILFLATFISTSIAGTLWAYKDFTELSNWHYGLVYALLIMSFLSAHEFGHYFAARFHKVDATLPFFIPFPPSTFLPSPFGTFGAVIKTRTPILSKKALFDIGAAGPIAGFIVAFGFLLYGLLTLPPIDFIYHIHPEYLIANHGVIPKTSLHFGDTILYYIMSHIFANPNGFLPPMNEIYHYPFLNVGWFGMFVTTLNMIPLGQLDGGHITYAMFGETQQKIARVGWWLIVILGIGGLLGMLEQLFKYDDPNSIYIFFQNIFRPALSWLRSVVPFYLNSWGGWLFWAFITRFVIKLKHPPVALGEKLDKRRMAIGWAALIILFLSISYNGIYYIE